MSATAPTSTTNAAAAPTDASKDKEGNTQTQLGALEEDDEFEEFPAQDWDDTETDLSNLTGGATAGTQDNLWEDNWDDDDIEDDFSKQLREEVAKAQAQLTSSTAAPASTAGPQPMEQ